MRNENNRIGLFFALIAFFTWGLVPIFWKQLDHFHSFELLGHRTLWGFVFLSLYLLSKEELGELKKIMRNPYLLKMMGLSTLFIFTNWLVFIWAINRGHILEVSLGYFTNPLFNVLLGTFFLKEKLRPLQWVAISLAGGGVLILALGNVGSPWIAIFLAGTFAIYGFVRKKVNMPSSIGLCFEMMLVSVPALFYFGWQSLQGELLFLQAPLNEKLLVIASGIITVAPLLAYGKAVVNLKYSTLGIMQYIAPTLQFLVGVFLYGEMFTPTHQLSFGLIWFALIAYSAESGYQLKLSKGRHA